MKTSTLQNNNSVTLLSTSRSSISVFAHRFIRLSLMAVLVLSLFFIIMLSGIGMGNDNINKTMYVSDQDVEGVQSILLDDSSLVAAEAATTHQGGGTGTAIKFSDTATVTNKTLYSNIAGMTMNSGVASYVGYWAGSSSSTNLNAKGNGLFGVYGSGTVRQKRITMNAYVNFDLGENLQKLAAAGKLTMTLSFVYGTDNGYDQDFYGGYKFTTVAVHAKENSGDSRLTGFTKVSAFRKKKGTEPRVTYSNVAVPSNAKFLVLGVCGTTNYSGIGGRYPDVFMEGQNVTFTSTDTIAPTIKLNENYLSATTYWQTSRAIPFKAYDNVATSKLQSVSASNGTSIINSWPSPTNSSDLTYTSAINAFVSGFTAKALDMSGNTQTYITYYNIANNMSSTTTTSNMSQAALKIDRTAPTITNVRFVKSVAPTIDVTSPYSGTVSMLITVTDTQSGVGQVIVSNSTTGLNVSVTEVSVTSNNSNPSSVNTGIYKLNLGNAANGDYTITVRDNARNSAGSLTDATRNSRTQSGWSFSYQDTVAPTIGATTLQFKERSSANPLSTSPTTAAAFKAYTAGTFASNYITMTFVITDTTGSNYLGGNSGYAKLSGMKVMYLNSAGTLVYLSPTSSSESFSNPTRTYSYTFDLPYTSSTSLYNINPLTGTAGAGTSCNGYTIWAIDMAGNPKITTGIQVKIDTIAPLIVSRTVASNEGSTRGSIAYANNNVTVTVVCSDFSDVNNINNGSGIKEIYLYNQLTNTLLDSRKSLSGTSVTQTFTLSNSSYQAYHYRIVVVDSAGNTSQWGVGNALGISNYYNNKNIETTKTFYALKDVEPVSIIFSYSIDGGAYVSTELTSNDTFTFPWTKAASVKFKFDIKTGCSGGNFVDISNSTSVGSIAPGVAVTGTAPNYEYTAGSTNIKTNPKSILIEKFAEGTVSYHYQLTSGANVSLLSPTIVTRIDRTAPTIALLGFGDLISTTKTFTTKEQATAAIVQLKTEDLLTNESAWFNAFGVASIYGIFYVEDIAAGVGTDNIPNSSDVPLQTSLTNVLVNFSHNEYTYEVSVKPVKYGGIYLVHVRFWHPDEMKTAKKGGTPLYNTTTQEYDLLSGTKLRYKISMFDFIGNESKAFMKGNNINMEYCVDPFPIRADLISMVQKDASDNITPYNCVDWTRNKIVITLKKTISLTPTLVQWGYYDIEDMPNGTVQGGTDSGKDVTTHGIWTSASDTGTAKTVVIEFPATSRCAQVFFRITNSCSSDTSQVVMYQYKDIDDVYKNIYLRQDITPAILKSVAFSTNPALKMSNLTADNQDILIFYEYNNNTKVWTRTSNNDAINVWSTGSSVKKLIDLGTKTIIYSEERLYLAGLYMYVLATDTQGTGGTGSGIDYINVTLDGIFSETLRLMTTDIATKTTYNVLGGGTNPTYTGDLSNTSYYSSATGVGMYCSGKLYGYQTASEIKSLDFYLMDKQGNNVNVVVTTDKDGKKIMPVIDNTKPEVSIFAATYGGTNYINAGSFSGLAIKQSLNVTFKVSNGVSGAKVYYRLGEYNKPLDASNPYKAYNTTDIPFGLISKTDGVGSWSSMATYTLPNNNASVQYTIDKNNSVKNRFEVLLVTTTGAFYYLDCGDVFIDIVPPVIDGSMTFFTRESDTNNNLPIVNYNTITKVNEVVGGAAFTNGDIYAYFYVYDTASGVERVYYDNNGTKESLTAITVLRTVGGIDVETTYYRLKIINSTPLMITAIDKTGDENNPEDLPNKSESAVFHANIDKTPVDVHVIGKKADGTDYILGEGNVFTNSAKVQVTITVNYGISGFGGAAYSVDGGAWTEISTGSLLGATWVKTAGINQHTIKIDFVSEQNSTYVFRAYNKVVDGYATGGTRPKGENTIKIAIDKTVPKIDLTQGNYNLITSVWHGTGQVLEISVSDLNSFNQQGSGVATIKLDYKVAGQSQDQIPMTLSGSLFTTGTATLNEYAEYTITMTDKAGNVATQKFIPRLDKNDPLWGSYDGATSNYKLLTVPSEGQGVVYTANTWSKDDIKALVSLIYSMSGVQLQYYRSNTEVVNPASIANGNWSNLSGGSALWSTNTPPPTDANRTMTKEDVEYLTSILAGANLSQYHYLRMVSGAGRTSSVLSLGYIKIDKETPTIKVETRISSNTRVWGTVNVDNNTTTFASWTSSNVAMNVSSTSTLVSSYTLYYRLSATAQWVALEYNYTNITGSTVTYTFGKNGAIPDASKMSLRHDVVESTNKATYQYYIQSGSGMKSIIYTVSEIKIDKTTPQLMITGKASNAYGESNGIRLNTATAAQYNAGLLDYTPSSPFWVSTNSVIISIPITGMGYSGLTLSIDGIVYETFNYGTANTVRYYVVSATSVLAVKLSSEAEDAFGVKSAKNMSANIWIDNDIPVVYVSGQVVGTKASNFDAASSYADKWYTSKVTINLTVGRYIKNIIDGTYSYQADTSASNDEIPSGYSIYYSINDGAWVENGQVLSINANNFNLGSFIDPIRNTYRFKIVSGSGMSYELGSSAINNVGTVVKSVSEIRTLIDTNNGLIKNLNDTDYRYTVNVDSRDFEIIGNHIMPITMSNGNVYNWTVSAEDNPVFSKDTVYKSSNGTSSGTFTLSAAASFKRGDYLRISYSTASYNYIFRYADYGNFNGTSWSNNVTNATSDNTETAGTFDYSFVNNNLSYNAYFMKELTAAYANTKLYLQSDAIANVEASASFIYKNAGGADEGINLKFNYVYKDMDGNIADKNNLSTGGYVVSAVISDSNINSFRLSNPAIVLIVKYFTETVVNNVTVVNSAIYPYTIYNEKDLGKVSSPHYDGYSENNGVFTLNAPSNYLSNHFVINSNLDLTSAFSGINGTFTGSLNGNNKSVTLAGGSIESYYGLFNKLSGTVTNLDLSLRNVLSLSNTILAGILAREIVDGTVNNVYVSGTISLIDCNLYAKIGGLAGYSENSVIGESGKAVYADMSIYNNGNGIQRAYIGGLIGNVGENTKLQYTYSYGDIKLYNMGIASEVGMVFGKIEDYVTESNRNTYYFNNYYLDKSAFVNGYAVSSFSSSFSVINDEQETLNTIRSKDYSEFVGVNTASGQVGATVIVGRLVRELVLAKLYRDMNLSYIFEVDGEEILEFNNGEGTFDSNLSIGNMSQFMMIDKYVTLYYSISGELDFSNYDAPIAEHKVFYGSIDGNKNTVYNFGSNVNAVDSSTYGFVGNLGGTVKGFIFENVNVDVAYVGNNKLSIGLIAGVMHSGSRVSDIIALGNIAVVTNNTVSLGGVAGEVYEGNIYDVFVMNNLKATATAVNIGGITGVAVDARLASYTNELSIDIDGAVFSMGRVESIAEGLAKAGSVIGDGNLVSSTNAKIFAIENNTYKGSSIVLQTIGSEIGDCGIAVTSFTDPSSVMRSTFFSDNTTNVFGTVFGTTDDRLYPLAGLGTENSKFIVKSNKDDISINDFKYINQALFASYNIEGDITFAAGKFQTIGKGLIFTGTIDGKNADSIGAEDGSVSSLLNVTDALVYKNSGSITDIVVNISYTEVVERGNQNDEYDLVFGAIAIYNEGVIRNVTVSGSIDISSVNSATTVVVSGFVGIDNGGIVDGDNKIQNSISGLNITVNGVRTVYAGGYIGIVDGQTTLSYGIGSGTLTINNSNLAYAGTLIGIARHTCDVSSLEGLDEYQYVVMVDGELVTDIIGASVY